MEIVIVLHEIINSVEFHENKLEVPHRIQQQFQHNNNNNNPIDQELLHKSE